MSEKCTNVKVENHTSVSQQSLPKGVNQSATEQDLDQRGATTEGQTAQRNKDGVKTRTVSTLRERILTECR